MSKQKIEEELLVQQHSKKIQNLNQMAANTNKTAQKELKDARESFKKQMLAEKEKEKSSEGKFRGELQKMSESQKKVEKTIV